MWPRPSICRLENSRPRSSAAPLPSHAPIGPELSAALSEFLRQCDQRKFSPPAPAPPFGAVAQALKLIDQAQTRRLALAQPAAPLTTVSVVSPPKESAAK